MDNDQEAIMKNKDSLIENFVDDLKEVIAKLEEYEKRAKKTTKYINEYGGSFNRLSSRNFIHAAILEAERANSIEVVDKIKKAKEILGSSLKAAKGLTYNSLIEKLLYTAYADSPNEEKDYVLDAIRGVYFDDAEKTYLGETAGDTSIVEDVITLAHLNVTSDQNVTVTSETSSGLSTTADDSSVSTLNDS